MGAMDLCSWLSFFLLIKLRSRIWKVEQEVKVHCREPGGRQIAREVKRIGVLAQLFDT
ncbi:hypothetical protein KC19_3G143300 [Ceratodon purpureus]|uniref:Uncharacterized protein n=1 Tax=Ceratodon purpureus TaxID=3225 RepID=A0A8T0ILR0_CERPU|nr:hypothetical protein KC19_3G143300 [Ceratodon purpureus]